MKMVPVKNFEKKVKKVSNEKLFKLWDFTSTLNNKEYYAVVLAEMRERGVDYEEVKEDEG